MGTELWYHEAPWHSDPDAALKAFQAAFLRENYDLHSLLPKALANARQSVAYTIEEGDTYHLLDLYQDEVQLLERLCSEPIPDDPAKQIEIVRKINASTGSEIGNVLDVRGISDHCDTHICQRLSESDMVRLVGTARPNIDQARQAIYKVHEDLRRGESICFPVYEDSGDRRPIAWYFIGLTVD